MVLDRLLSDLGAQIGVFKVTAISSLLHLIAARLRLLTPTVLLVLCQVLLIQIFEHLLLGCDALRLVLLCLG